MINIFERADFRNCTKIVRNIVCEDESEEDDSSDCDEPIPQPETYPHELNSPSLSPKLSKCVRFSSCEEYSLINPVTAKGLPKGENCV